MALSKTKRISGMKFFAEMRRMMTDMVLCLGWDEKGYSMVIPRSGKPKLRMATYSDSEQRE